MRPAEDRDSAPWWEAVRAHRLTVQRCGDCATLRFPPRTICAGCRSRAWEWREVSGRGAVASWIVTHHAFLPGFAVPSVLALVRLAEQDDLVMYGDLPGVRPGEMAPELAVCAVFEDVEPGFTLVRWHPAG